VDVNDNESVYAVVSPQQTVGVSDAPASRVLALTRVAKSGVRGHMTIDFHCRHHPRRSSSWST